VTKDEVQKKALRDLFEVLVNHNIISFDLKNDLAVIHNYDDNRKDWVEYKDTGKKTITFQLEEIK